MQATVSLGGRLKEGDWHTCRGKKGRKNKENNCSGYCSIYGRYFLDDPLIKQRERPIASCRFWRCRPLGMLATSPGLSPPAGSPVE